MIDRISQVNNLKAGVFSRLDMRREISDDDVLLAIKNEIFNTSDKNYLMLSEKVNLCEAVFNSLRRFDVIQKLIDDDTVTEIMINGPFEIFIERKGCLQKADVQFESVQTLEDVIQNIVSKVNRMVNESSPIVDARLSDGSRICVVLPPIALNGPILTIRKFPSKPLKIADLIEFGSITAEAALVLQKLVEAKYNIFISGGTGSGKTTFLNVLADFIPGDERIITIEDSAELQIRSVENIVKLEKRNSNTEGRGEISIRDLIKTSLRMRPDRIVVGEVRGDEALDMLTAMNTGHDGSLSTGHANSTKDMLARIETMVLGASNMPLIAIRQQIASAIDIVVHLSRLRDKSRRVLDISEVIGVYDGEIKLNPLFIFDEKSEVLLKTQNKITNILKLNLAGMEEF